MRFDNPMWRARPVRSAVQVAKSLVRRRIPSLARPVVPYDGGRSRIVASLETSLGLALYRYGVDAPDLELVRRLLDPGDVFVDGGANIGLFTLVGAASVSASGRVIAFEPADKTRAILERNVKLNGFQWVTIRHEALDDRVGARTMSVFTGNAAGLSSFAPGVAGGDAHMQETPTITLDEAVGDNADRVSVMKLDLEGAELSALRGARGLLEKRHPVLLLEVEPSHLARQGASAEELITLLRGLGYAFYRAEKDGDVPVVLRPEARPAERGAVANLVAVFRDDPRPARRVRIAAG